MTCVECSRSDLIWSYLISSNLILSYLNSWWRHQLETFSTHYSDVIMGSVASQITSLTNVYSSVYSDADQRKHQSSASLGFVRGIHRGPMNSSQKWPVTRKMFLIDDVIMVTSPLWWESTGHRCIPLTKASDVDLWCFLWSTPEQTV